MNLPRKVVKAHSQAQGDKGLHEVMGAGFRAMFKQLCVLTAEGLSLRGLSMHSCHQCSIFSRVHLADINLRSSVMLKKKEASFGVRWSGDSQLCHLPAVQTG